MLKIHVRVFHTNVQPVHVEWVRIRTRKRPKRKKDVHRVDGPMSVHWIAPVLFECSPWLLKLLVSELSLTSFFFQLNNTVYPFKQQHVLLARPDVSKNPAVLFRLWKLQFVKCIKQESKTFVVLAPLKSRTKVCSVCQDLYLYTGYIWKCMFFSTFWVLAFHLQLCFLKTLSQADTFEKVDMWTVNVELF